MHGICNKTFNLNFRCFKIYSIKTMHEYENLPSGDMNMKFALFPPADFHGFCFFMFHIETNQLSCISNEKTGFYL